MKHKPIYEIILKTPDGREKRMLVYLPTEEIKQNFLASAERKGLEVTITNH